MVAGDDGSLWWRPWLYIRVLVPTIYEVWNLLKVTFSLVPLFPHQKNKNNIIFLSLVVLMIAFKKKFDWSIWGTERRKHRFVVPLIDAVIGWFSYVPWSGIKLTTLVYGGDVLTNWAPQPGWWFLTLRLPLTGHQALYMSVPVVITSTVKEHSKYKGMF